MNDTLCCRRREGYLETQSFTRITSDDIDLVVVVVVMMMMVVMVVLLAMTRTELIFNLMMTVMIIIYVITNKE